MLQCLLDQIHHAKNNILKPCVVVSFLHLVPHELTLLR